VSAAAPSPLLSCFGAVFAKNLAHDAANHSRQVIADNLLDPIQPTFNLVKPLLSPRFEPFHLRLKGEQVPVPRL
jgi:hypothetical protein